MDRRKKKRGEEKKNDRREMKKSIIFSIRHELIKKKERIKKECVERNSINVKEEL